VICLNGDQCLIPGFKHKLSSASLNQETQSNYLILIFHNQEANLKLRENRILLAFFYRVSADTEQTTCILTPLVWEMVFKSTPTLFCLYSSTPLLYYLELFESRLSIVGLSMRYLVSLELGISRSEPGPPPRSNPSSSVQLVLNYFYFKMAIKDKWCISKKVLKLL